MSQKQEVVETEERHMGTGPHTPNSSSLSSLRQWDPFTFRTSSLETATFFCYLHAPTFHGPLFFSHLIIHYSFQNFTSPHLFAFFTPFFLYLPSPLTSTIPQIHSIILLPFQLKSKSFINQFTICIIKQLLQNSINNKQPYFLQKQYRTCKIKKIQAETEA